MTYDTIIEYAKKGKTLKLPNFIGYFKWNYGTDNLTFYNGEYQCTATDLDILNRKDFYYIV